MAVAEKIKIGDYKEILSQLGGNKFLAMTGSKVSYSYNDKGYVYIMIKLTKNLLKAQYLKIQLNSLDLYDLEFSKIKRTLKPELKSLGIKVYDEEHITIETINNVYCDQLQEIFSEKTGLLTKLF